MTFVLTGNARSTVWRRCSVIAGALGLMAVLSACTDAMQPGAGRAPSAAGLAADTLRPVDVIAVDAANVAGFGAAGLSTDPQSWVYQVGPGDVLQLHVVDEPELTLPGGYLVGHDGTVQVPFLGPVAVAGLSAGQIRAAMTERLRRYRPAPQVDVRVAGFNARHATVVGAVARPARHPLTATPMTVIDAINASGGLADTARSPRVVLIRGGQRHPVDFRAFLTTGEPLPILHDGDVVQVAVGGVAAAPAPVMLHTGVGQVRQIQANGTALSGLFAAAGMGADDTAYVLRPVGSRVQALFFDGAQIMNPLVGGRFVPAPGDNVVLTRGHPEGNQGHHRAIEPALRHMARG